MPHSSGGGSHGGGSHHSSSHHSSGSGGSRTRVQRTPFAGARRYVIYRNNAAEYIYSDHDLHSNSKARYLILLFYIPFIIAIFSMLAGVISHPKKLKVDYTPSIMIDDYADVIPIEDQTKLMDSMMHFYQETGISPYVLTVNHDQWMPYYDNLELFAYDRYVNLFEDEKHWLIVYSEPEYEDEYFLDWYFEGMQGDDTDPIITQRIANAFTDDLQEKLTDRTHYSVGQAIASVFDTYAVKAMETNVEFDQLVPAGAMALFIGVHMFFMVFYNPDKKYANAVECKGEMVQEANCDYCGGVYVIGTVTSCPHCNGAIRAHSYYTEV